MCHRVTLTTIWTNTHLGEDVSLMISCCVRVCSILRMYEHTHESGILCIASVEASQWIWKKQLLYFNLCFIVWCQLFNCQKTVNWERRGWRQRERQWRDAKDEMKRQKEGEREDCYFPLRKPVTIHCCSSNCSSEGQSGNFNTRFSNLRAMSERDLQFQRSILTLPHSTNKTWMSVKNTYTLENSAGAELIRGRLDIDLCYQQLMERSKRRSILLFQ